MSGYDNSEAVVSSASAGALEWHAVSGMQPVVETPQVVDGDETTTKEKEGNDNSLIESDSNGNGNDRFLELEKTKGRRLLRSNGWLENGNGSTETSENKDREAECHVGGVEVTVFEEGEKGDNAVVGEPDKLPSNSIVCYYNPGGDDSGSEEEQISFMKELESLYREKGMEFKPPKFYGEGVNCLKLWRQVSGLGGYDQVTSSKLWRQVGEAFNPPKTCTTVSWTFRNFYGKALLEYEKHKVKTGEFRIMTPTPEPIASESQGANRSSSCGRARRESAARAMQGWHSQRELGNGEISDPIIKGPASAAKKEKNQKNGASHKRKTTASLEQDDRVVASRSEKKRNMIVDDDGPPAEWVKVNVKQTKDCYEIYALVPGLMREEVLVQSDAAGRLIISGEPENPNNLWGVTPFKKVITLPSRIDPHTTSAVVTLHGQLFVRVPYEQSKP